MLETLAGLATVRMAEVAVGGSLVALFLENLPTSASTSSCHSGNFGGTRFLVMLLGPSLGISSSASASPSTEISWIRVLVFSVRAAASR